MVGHSSKEERVLYSSEAVCEGHPDKVCDQISDSVLDACVKEDEGARVGCECCTKTGMVMIFGEISTSSTINYEAVIRTTLRDIGYDDPAKGLDYKSANVIVAVEEQSPELAVHIDSMKLDDLAASDQCIVTGYATDETEELMPLSHVLATRIAARLSHVRKTKIIEWLRPDGKVMVTCEYKLSGKNVTPVRVNSVVLSIQHEESVDQEEIREQIMEIVIKPSIPAKFRDDDTIYHLNPAGRFVLGGPQADAGLSGRKLNVDGYGDWVPASGSFSGKDATKIDRTAAYAARWIAKSLVKAHLCKRVQVQLAYAIGIRHPISIRIDSFGTGLTVSNKTDTELLDIVHANFDLRPGRIIRDLDLRRPIMTPTSKFGHFGSQPNSDSTNTPPFPWEQEKDLRV
uniref:S-adenosylmethionine synthase n=1 Tax=Aureoumbra lagunensis TaxID=44058 RepID=A0A7S3NPC7_9STRA|mmetsp:Transcript_19507/g.25267  ORF Transcript_19507/g.25267 Transcript_19507/m.25267 type:complete len:400 (+) Transcript_19507:30-1229(+)